MRPAVRNANGSQRVVRKREVRETNTRALRDVALCACVVLSGGCADLFGFETSRLVSNENRGPNDAGAADAHVAASQSSSDGAAQSTGAQTSGAAVSTSGEPLSTGSAQSTGNAQSTGSAESGNGEHLSTGAQMSADETSGAQTSAESLEATSPSTTSSSMDVSVGTDGSDASVSSGSVSSGDGPLDAGYASSTGPSSGQMTNDSTDASTASSTVSTYSIADAGDSQPSSPCGNGVVDPDELCDPNEAERGEDCATNCTWRIRSVVAGQDHTCMLAANGDVKCWGWNYFGQLGLDVREPTVNLIGREGRDLPALKIRGSATIALTAGLVHTCALNDEEEVRCWGNHTDGKLGYPQLAQETIGNEIVNGEGEMETLPAVDLGRGARARAVAAGRHHTCAILQAGQIKCWGQNTYVQLGVCTGIPREPGICESPAFVGTQLGTMGDAIQPVALGDESVLDGGASGSESGTRERNALKVATGGYFTCANLNDGAIRCWGMDYHGQRGLPNPATGYPMPGGDNDLWDAVLNSPGGATDVVVGHDHSCAIMKDDASVRCWGKNDKGQLGQDQPDDIHSEQMTTLDSIFPPGVRIKRLAAGENHTCALSEEHELRCWGSDEFGQLGIEDKSALGIEGDVGDEEDEMSKLQPIQLGEGNYAVDVAAGYNHTCAILNNGRLKCWGKNTYGQLGLKDTDNRGDNAHEMSELPFVELF